MRNVGHYEPIGDLKFFIPNYSPLPRSTSMFLAGDIGVLYGETKSWPTKSQMNVLNV